MHCILKWVPGRRRGAARALFDNQRRRGEDSERRVEGKAIVFFREMTGSDFPLAHAETLTAAAAGCSGLNPSKQSLLIVNLKESKHALDDLQLLSVQGALLEIEECILEYAQGVTDSALTCLAGSTVLTHLNLNACQEYTDSGLEKLSKTCTGLVNLSLYWNVNIGDKGVGAMAGANTALTKLNLSGCKGVTDAGLTKVARSTPHLTSLDLTRCCQLTNPGLVALSESCTMIRDLRFYACGYIGNQGVSSLIKRLQHMVVLDLCGSKEITDEVCAASLLPPPSPPSPSP